MSHACLHWSKARGSRGRPPGSGRVQAQLGAVKDDPGADEIGKMGKLGAHQIFNIGSPPLAPNQMGRERLDTLSKTPK
jgi:hypothetical protein